MNRVAAQAARDKKKAQQSDVERLVAKLAAENRVLRAENSELRQRRTQLESENANLRTRLGGESSSSGAAAPEAGVPAEGVLGVGVSGIVSGACAVSPAVVGHGLPQRVRALLSTLVLLALSCLCRPPVQSPSLPRRRLAAWSPSAWSSSRPLSPSTLRAITRLQSPSPTLFALRVGKTQRLVLTNSALRRLLLALATRLKQMRFDSRRSMEILRRLPVTPLQPMSSHLSPVLTPTLTSTAPSPVRRMRCH